MTTSSPPITTLESHAALASRIIRFEPISSAYFQWTTRPGAQLEPPRAPDKQVLATVEALVRPLIDDCSGSTKRELESAGRWIASIGELLYARQLAGGNQFLGQLLAAALLPLYRTLATHRLQEGFAQTRRRLGEALSLVSLVDCLELDELLEPAVGERVSPHRAVGELIKIDLSQLDYLIACALPGYSGDKDRFDYSTTQTLLKHRPGERLPVQFQTPDWATPQTLWILSHELTSVRSELILPRSWIDTSAPWSKIADHWRSLEQSILQALNLRGTSLPSPLDDVQLDQLLDRCVDEEVAGSGSLAAIESDDERSLETMDQLIERELITTSPRVHRGSQCQPLRTVGCEPAATDGEVSASRTALATSKVLIGEISGLNDPAFSNVVRRQVAVGRNEERSVCLSMITVTAEHEPENQSLADIQENGLSRWQQKLVNWLSQQATIHEPLAFLTRAGQLLLLALDTDRNEMTTVLRQGLLEVLTGKHNSSVGDLQQINIPARFHVGIASTTSPGASFDSEDLIASAHRCLTVAQRLGKASIKSIEVF